MRTMSLEQVRDELIKEAEWYESRLGDYKHADFRAMADAIDAHLTSREAKGEAGLFAMSEAANDYIASGWEYQGSGMDEKSRWFLVDFVSNLPALYTAQPKPEQAVGDGVTDEQVERAAKKHMEVRGLGMLSPWESCTEETRASYRIAMRRALEDFASLASRPVEAVATPVEVTDEDVEAACQQFFVGDVRKPWPWRDTQDMDEPEATFADMRSVLEAFAKSAALAHTRPTGEQAGDVVAFRIVGRHGPYPWVDGQPDPEPEFIVGENERIEYAYTQPRPMGGVPDVEAMTRRFLGWRLPDDFAPDCGISFKPLTNPNWMQPVWPVGTNLFTYEQAKAMFEYALAAAPEVDRG
jgi:hypothetical protein